MTTHADEVKFIHEPPKGEVRETGYGLMPRYFHQGVHERYGPIVLSIQAGYGNYAEPRDTYLSNLGDYTEVEIALMDLRFSNGASSFSKDNGFRPLGAWTKPDRIGLSFTDMFQHDDMEGWVSWPIVNAIREQLAALYGGKDNDPYRLDQMVRDANGYNSEEYRVFALGGPTAVEIYRKRGDGGWWEDKDDAE